MLDHLEFFNALIDAFQATDDGKSTKDKLFPGVVFTTDVNKRYKGRDIVIHVSMGPVTSSRDTPTFCGSEESSIILTIVNPSTDTEDALKPVYKIYKGLAQIYKHWRLETPAFLLTPTNNDQPDLTNWQLLSPFLQSSGTFTVPNQSGVGIECSFLTVYTHTEGDTEITP